MTKRSNADFFKVLIAQIRQDDKANVILGKSLSVLPEPSFPSQSATCCIGAPCGLDALRVGRAGKPITCAKLVEACLDQSERWCKPSDIANVARPVSRSLA